MTDNRKLLALAAGNMNIRLTREERMVRAAHRSADDIALRGRMFYAQRRIHRG